MPNQESATPTSTGSAWPEWTRGLAPDTALPPARSGSDLRRPIQGYTPERLAALTGADVTSARKVVAAVLKRGAADLDELALPIRREDRRRIAAQQRVGRLGVIERLASRVDPFLKYLFEAEDRVRFESVRIPLERVGRFSVCISSQAGCGMGCAFCATARLGLLRNLASWEMVEQVRRVGSEVPAGTRVHGVVFQGMGEPLANVEQVIEAILAMSHPCGLAIDQRSITVCTAGIANGIRRLAEAGVRARLAVSIGSALPELRSRLIPLERRQPLALVLEAVAEHTRRTSYAPLLAVTLLGGVNTSLEDADHLTALAISLRDSTGVAPRLSLIGYNPIGPGDPFTRASPEESEAFRERLASAGLAVTRRYSGGADVAAGCGQLVAGRAT